MPKRYYWLKLKDDFFSSKRIKKLRNMAGGDTYVIIYLKMQLMAMKTEGVLTWTGLEDSFADELALDLDEKPTDVEVTLYYLLNTGLAETQDNHRFFFPYAIENTGSEDASAQRVRDFRRRQALQSNQGALQSNTDVTRVKRECNVEKEIEKELEIEIEKDTPRVRERRDEQDDGFQAFWAAYPKKNGGDIREAYLEYCHVTEDLGVAPEELTKAASNMSGSVEPQEIRYLPNAAKWLRNRGWETPVAKKKPEGKPKQYTTAEEYKAPAKIDTALIERNKRLIESWGKKESES